MNSWCLSPSMEPSKCMVHEYSNKFSTENVRNENDTSGIEHLYFSGVKYEISKNMKYQKGRCMHKVLD